MSTASTTKPNHLARGILHLALAIAELNHAVTELSFAEEAVSITEWTSLKRKRDALTKQTTKLTTRLRKTANAPL